MAPKPAPTPATSTPHNYRYADIAVTYTAAEFQGIYRGKQCHEPDFEDVLLRAVAAGCSKILLTTMTLKGAYRNLEMCRKFPGRCYMTLGIHPYHASGVYSSSSLSTSATDEAVDGVSASEKVARNDLDELVKFGQQLVLEEKGNSPLVAFGEIGLDYHYLERSSLEDQKRAFVEQLEIATTVFPQLPLFLHARDCTDDFIEVVTPFLSRLSGSLDNKKKGVVHSFAGSKEEMLRLVELGFDVSVNAISFKTDELLEMVRAVPLSRLQLETDAPWCGMPSLSSCLPEVAGYLKNAAPLPSARDRRKFVKGQMVKERNESCTIGRIAMVVAGIKGISLDDVVEQTWNNSVQMFGFGQSTGTEFQ